jgi:hypothetical protein
MRSRATNLEELEIILSRLFTQESRQRGLAFRPSTSDVIISPYAKCGTTWLQQIVHGLRTRGSMDFDEISAVTPWLEVAYDLGLDLAAPQVAEPRVFKSHLSWYEIPKGGRYVVSFRDPRDAIVSFYRFFEGWLFEPGSISLETLAGWRWPRAESARSGYWYHLSSWWEQRHNPDVLLLCYEDMKTDLPGTVRRVAHFMGIEADDSLLDTVVRQSSREFMLAHQHQFDASHMRRAGEERVGLPPNGDSAKVTLGAPTDARYQLPPALKQELDEIWWEQVQRRFGLQNYGELRHALRRLHSSGRHWVDRYGMATSKAMEKPIRQ